MSSTNVSDLKLVLAAVVRSINDEYELEMVFSILFEFTGLL